MVATLTSPVTHILVPDARFTPAALASTDPAGGTLASEDNLNWETVATSTNLTDPNGLEGARPVASGPATTATTLTVATLLPGAPDASSTYTYTQSGTVYGATPTYIPTGVSTILGAASGDGYRLPRGVVYPDGSAFVVSERWTGTDAVYGMRYSDTTHSWSAPAGAVIRTMGTAFTASIHAAPTAWLIPSDTTSGYVTYVGWLEIVDAGSVSLMIAYSTDDGVNFSSPAKTNLKLDTATATYERLDVVYDDLGQQLTLALHKTDGATETIETYRSDDFGATWSAISTISASENVRLKVRCGVIYMATITTGGDLDIRSRTSITPGWVTVALDITSAVAATVHVDHLGYEIFENGTHAVYFRRAAASEARLDVMYSTDGGANWGGGSTFDYPYNDDTPIRVLQDHTAAALAEGLNIQGSLYNSGRVWLLGNFTSAGTTDYAMFALLYGEITSLPRGSDAADNGLHQFYPVALADTKSTQYTWAGGSGRSIVVDAAGNQAERIDNTNATGYYTHTTATGSVLRAALVLGASSSGGSTAASDIVLRIEHEIAATGNMVRVELRIDMTNRQVQMYDLVTAANLGTAATWTTGAPVEFLLDVEPSKASGWVRILTSESYTSIASNQSLGSAAGALRDTTYGKANATTAQVDVLWFYPSSSANYGAGFSSTTDIVGIPASSLPARVPAGPHIRWDGSPLLPGNTWPVRTRSDTPVSYTSALSVAPSPLRRWESPAVTAGSTVTVAVYDLGSSYQGKVSVELTGLLAGEVQDAATVYFDRWTGAAWSNIANGSMRIDNLTSGSVSMQRDAAASYQLRPGATANAGARYWRADEMVDYWCVVSDGVDTAAGRIVANGEGYFSADTSSPLPAWVELDPTTVVTVAGGGWASIATSTNTGTLEIYARDAALVMSQASESTRYYRIRVAMAPGATLPAAGALWPCRVLTMGRPYRAGASITQTTDPRVTRPLRTVELPYDQILVPAGTYSSSGFGGHTSFNGSTPRAMVENPVPTVEALYAQVGRQHGRRRGIPIGLVLDGRFTADPASTAQMYVGRSVVIGYLGDSMSLTAGEGFLRPHSTAGDQHGTALVVDGSALYLPTV